MWGIDLSSIAERFRQSFNPNPKKIPQVITSRQKAKILISQVASFKERVKSSFNENSLYTSMQTYNELARSAKELKGNYTHEEALVLFNSFKLLRTKLGLERDLVYTKIIGLAAESKSPENFAWKVNLNKKLSFYLEQKVGYDPINARTKILQWYDKWHSRQDYKPEGSLRTHVSSESWYAYT